MNTNYIDDGGPAFPTGERLDRNGQIEQYHVSGMSLRDWMASNEVIHPDEIPEWELLEALAGPRPEGNWTSNPLGWFTWSNKWRAIIKYVRADAMLEARKGGRQ